MLFKEGQCINTSLHESGESWKPEFENGGSDGSASSEPIKCIRCGAQNPPEGFLQQMRNASFRVTEIQLVPLILPAATLIRI